MPLSYSSSIVHTIAVCIIHFVLFRTEKSCDILKKCTFHILELPCRAGLVGYVLRDLNPHRGSSNHLPTGRSDAPYSSPHHGPQS